MGHIKRHIGGLMRVDMTAQAVEHYQTSRLKEKAAPKSINEETGFLLRLLGEQGDMIRAKMRRERKLKLKVRGGVAKAYSPEERAALIEATRKRRLPCIHTALMRGSCLLEIPSNVWKIFSKISFSSNNLREE